jgi:hypothetical protein
MGNQPSAPQRSPESPSNAPPPLPPVCDAECQRQKKLSGLKAAFDEKTATRDTDPAGYEQARIAYFTELNGQGWLAQEKQRIASEEIAPVVSGYQDRYKQLQSETKNQGVFVNLMSMLKADEQQDQQELGGLNKKLESEKDKADALNRLNELNQQQTAPSSSPQISSTTWYILIAIAVILVGYFLYSKMTSSTNPVQVAGKRLSRLITR